MNLLVNAERRKEIEARRRDALDKIACAATQTDFVEASGLAFACTRDIPDLLADHATLQEQRAEALAELENTTQELQMVLSDWNDLRSAIGSPTNGAAVGYAKQVVRELATLRRWVRWFAAGFTREKIIGHATGRGCTAEQIAEIEGVLEGLR